MRRTRRYGLPLSLLFSALCACSSNGLTPGSPSTSNGAQQLVASARASSHYLYDIAFNGYIESFALPMQSGEPPAASTATKGQGVAAFGTHLFASTRTASELSEFRLPLVNGEKPSISLPVPNTGALAAGTGFVYAGTQGSPGTVVAYATPLKQGEPEAATLTSGVYLPAVLAADTTHLYVDNQNDTITSYPLPLHDGETPDGTLKNVTEAGGIAVYGSKLFVSRYDTAQVFVYRLPFTRGERPSVTLNTRYNWTGPLAATSSDLYVSDVQRYAWDYPLPLHAGEKSSKNVSAYPMNGNALAVAP